MPAAFLHFFLFFPFRQRQAALFDCVEKQVAFDDCLGNTGAVVGTGKLGIAAVALVLADAAILEAFSFCKAGQIFAAGRTTYQGRK